MKITKHRTDGRGWAVRFDGHQTPFEIIKGDRPKYREPQMYDVLDGDEWLFEARSVHAAMGILGRVAAEAAKAGGQ